MSGSTTRERIVAIADQLFYQRGFDHTSFSDIADEAGISRGNFYYHFRTKDDILAAVIGLRLANTRRMLEDWEQEAADPEQRILKFVHILIRNQAGIKRHGCPVGTLCTELAKLEHALQTEAGQVFSLFRAWLREQFKLLGCETEADELAMHVLAWSQGVAVLANTFRDQTFIRNEVRHISQWLESRKKAARDGRSPQL